MSRELLLHPELHRPWLDENGRNLVTTRDRRNIITHQPAYFTRDQWVQIDAALVKGYRKNAKLTGLMTELGLVFNITELPKIDNYLKTGRFNYEQDDFVNLKNLHELALPFPHSQVIVSKLELRLAVDKISMLTVPVEAQGMMLGRATDRALVESGPDSILNTHNEGLLGAKGVQRLDHESNHYPTIVMTMMERLGDASYYGPYILLHHPEAKLRTFDEVTNVPSHSVHGTWDMVLFQATPDVFRIIHAYNLVTIQEKVEGDRITLRHAVISVPQVRGPLGVIYAKRKE